MLVEPLSGAQLIIVLAIAASALMITFISIAEAISKSLVARHQAKRPPAPLLLHCTHGDEHGKTQSEQDHMRRITSKLGKAAEMERTHDDGA